MLGLKNPIDGLLNSADRVAQRVPADRLFSWLARTLAVPPGWLAWVMRTDRDPLMIHSGQSCDSQGVTEALFVRERAIECTIQNAGVRSADGHEFSGTLRVALRVMAEPAELAAFSTTLLASNTSISTSDLQRYLQWAGHEALAELASRHAADELLKPLDPAEIGRIVQQRMGALCLAGGLVIDGPTIVAFESTAYLDHRRRELNLARQQKEADARVQIQQALASAEKERLGHLVAMLEQMRETSQQHAERSLMELLQAFSPAERGQMYGALWSLRRPAQRTRYVAVVSGMELLLFDPSDLTRPARRHRLPETLGPLRSISIDERSLDRGQLLIGAGQGVMIVDLETGAVARRLGAGHPASQAPRGGVNAAAAAGSLILGSHSELGVLAWQHDQDEPANFLLTELTRSAKTVRCLQVFGDRTWVAIDERVVSFRPDGGATIKPEVYIGSQSAISALTLAGNYVYAGNQEGQVLRWAIDEPRDMSLVRKATGHPVESVDVVDAGGVEWLLLADQQDAIAGCVLGDTYSCRYQAGSSRIRRAAVAEDIFVAMNDNRDRLIAWQPEKPAGPLETVVIPYLTGSSIQDICLIPV